jgi:serine/threonine protein phosphatase PrpC
MFFEHRAYWLPKDVQDPNAYEDAFYVDADRGMAAICDGVSSALFSGRWAGIMAKAVVDDTPDVNDPQAMETWLKTYRDAWSTSIDENSLAWHQKPKLLDGGATTLLWVKLAASGANDGVARPYQVRTYSIGDCCLFHVRGGQVLQTFPIQQSSRFEDQPQVIHSVYKRAEIVSFEAMETQCNPGDLLVLCTDAVAAWTMRQLESGGGVDWDSHWNTSVEDWQRWLIGLRENNQIRYDDSTMVLIRIGPGEPETTTPTPQEEDNLLDAAEDKLKGALESVRGSLRKGLRGLAESKWLSDRDSK